MLKKIFQVAEALFFLAIMLAACVALGIVFPKGSDAPAWVQAIGSIGAILVAIWVFWRQGERQRQEREEQKAEEQINVLLQLELIIREMSNFLGRLKSQILLLPNHLSFHFDEPGSNDIRRSLNTLPYSKLDQFSMQRVFQLRWFLSEIHIRYLPRTGGYNITPWPEDRDWINEMSERVAVLINEINQVLVDRNARQPDA
jgi:hypothetical protein